MLRLLGAALVVAVGGWLGASAAGSLRARVRALEAWQEALEQLAGELAFSLPALPELAKHLAGSCLAPAGDTFLRLTEELEAPGERSFAQVWEECLTQAGDGLSLSDRQLLLGLGNLLGRYDWESQCRGVERVLRELERRQEEAREDLGQRGRAWGTLGVAAGAFLAILLL